MYLPGIFMRDPLSCARLQATARRAGFRLSTIQFVAAAMFAAPQAEGESSSYARYALSEPRVSDVYKR